MRNDHFNAGITFCVVSLSVLSTALFQSTTAATEMCPNDADSIADSRSIFATEYTEWVCRYSDECGLNITSSGFSCREDMRERLSAYLESIRQADATRCEFEQLSAEILSFIWTIRCEDSEYFFGDEGRLDTVFQVMADPNLAERVSVAFEPGQQQITFQERCGEEYCTWGVSFCLQGDTGYPSPDSGSTGEAQSECIFTVNEGMPCNYDYQLDDLRDWEPCSHGLHCVDGICRARSVQSDHN